MRRPCTAMKVRLKPDPTYDGLRLADRYMAMENGLAGGVEDVAHLAGQRVGRERLLQERRAFDEDAMTNDRLVRVAGDVQHAQAGMLRCQAIEQQRSI